MTKQNGAGKTWGQKDHSHSHRRSRLLEKKVWEMHCLTAAAST